MNKRLLLLLVIFSLAVSTYLPARAQSAADGPIYIVQSGDSLSAIASRFSVDLTALMSANNLTDPNQLYAGQELLIPGLQGVSGTLNTEVINFGDSYRSLIRRTQVPEAVFRKLNHVVSPSEFYVGVSMIVPAGASAQTLDTRFSLSQGESLLESAVKHNSDVWTLTRQNHLRGTWSALPGDTLFTTGGANLAPAVSGLPSAFLEASIRDLPIKQGGTGVIRVKTEPGVTLSGTLVDHPLHFFAQEDGYQVALQGVHRLLEPGVYPLRLDASLPDGGTQSYEQLILVTSGNYLEGENLVVDSALIDPAITAPEQAQLEAVTAPVTPEKYWVGGFISPAISYADSTYFTSRYGTRRTYLGQGTDLSVDWWHTGLDFGGGDGLPITAPASGKVVVAENWTVRGGTTIIDHG